MYHMHLCIRYYYSYACILDRNLTEQLAHSLLAGKGQSRDPGCCLIPKCSLIPTTL